MRASILQKYSGFIMIYISGSNGFCGFRYDPQMNADERRHMLTACAAGQSAGASAVCKDHRCLKSYAATKSVRISYIYKYWV